VTENNHYERRFDVTKLEISFSVQRQSTSMWKALFSICAWILALMETTRRKVANCSRHLPPQLETHGHRLLSASIMEWWASPCLLIEAAVENRHQQCDWVQQRGTVCSTMLTVHYSLLVPLRTEVTESRGRTSVGAEHISRWRPFCTDWSRLSNVLGRLARVTLP